MRGHSKTSNTQRIHNSCFMGKCFLFPAKSFIIFIILKRLSIKEKEYNIMKTTGLIKRKNLFKY